MTMDKKSAKADEQMKRDAGKEAAAAAADAAAAAAPTLPYSPECAPGHGPMVLTWVCSSCGHSKPVVTGEVEVIGPPPMPVPAEPPAPEPQPEK